MEAIERHLQDRAQTTAVLQTRGRIVVSVALVVNVPGFEANGSSRFVLHSLQYPWVINVVNIQRLQVAERMPLWVCTTALRPRGISEIALGASSSNRHR